MRLLNTTSLMLETFIRDVPDYAILSHTWEEEEVTYKDLTSVTDSTPLYALYQALIGLLIYPLTREGNAAQHISSQARQKKGWEKIARACAYAASRGWEYIWIDTCCIDKSDLSELSEAINSMFRWYESATVCYAYLADVSKWAKDGDTSRNSVEFRNSRWFTRGWTLQELLAPKKLEFLDRDWKPLGSRNEWALEIEKATNIRREHLTDFRRCCLATKLSWAANRQTTRIEDQAYSLLGLLGVHMPLIYGEGENAFIRLQYELIRSSNDESIFVWDASQDRTRLDDETTHFQAARNSEQFAITTMPPSRLCATVLEGWDSKVLVRLRDDNAALLARSPKYFAGSTGLQTYRHDARLRFEMTNAGLSINAELFQEGSLRYSTQGQGVYFIHLNCSREVGDQDSYSSENSGELLFLRAVHFDHSATRSDQALLRHDARSEQVPTVFNKIGHMSHRVDPNFVVNLGRHDILILNEEHRIPCRSSTSRGLAREMHFSFDAMEWNPVFYPCAYKIHDTYSTTLTRLRRLEEDRGCIVCGFDAEYINRTHEWIEQTTQVGQLTQLGSAAYTVEENGYIMFIFTVAKVKHNLDAGRASAKYCLVLSWDGTALTCGILRCDRLENVTTTALLSKLEDRRPNVAPGPLPNTVIRALIKREENKCSRSPSGLTSSRESLRFRVALCFEDPRCDEDWAYRKSLNKSS